jgi:signal transduction histidine kinase/ligand-binding sensor domain-containing protein
MKTANLIAAAVVLFFVTQSAHALDPTQPFSSYIRTHFNDEKVELSTVNEIVQSRDGFLWVVPGSRNLSRFDGQHFTSLSLPDSRHMALAPNGDLWVGGSELIQIPAAALNQFGALQTTSYRIGEGSSNIISLHFSRGGILWVGTNKGLYRFDQGVFSLQLPQVEVRNIEESINGDLLVITSLGFIVWNGSRAMPQSELAAQLGLRVDQIFHVFEDKRGITWFSTASGMARRVGASIEKLQPWGPKYGAYRGYEDPQGNVWVIGAHGLFRATAAGLEVADASIKVRCIYGDQDGNLWIGTNGDGLFRFKDRSVRMVTIADGLPNNTVMAVLTSHDGTLWTGFNCGGVTHFDGHSFHTYNEKDGLLNSCVWSLAEDANHDLWIGTYGGGAFRFHNGSFTQYSKGQGLISDIVAAIVPTRDGSLWFATRSALTRLRNGEVRNYTKADGLSSSSILSIYEDRSGGIWIGSTKGLDRLDGDRFLKVSAIPNDESYLLGEDSSGHLYVGVGEKDIFRVSNGELIDVGTAHSATYMTKTGEGDLWFNGSTLFRIPLASAEKRRAPDEPLDVVSFEVTDGLLSPEGSIGYPNSALTRDGKLWMATVQGLAMFDLPRLRKSDRKPGIYMEELTVGRNQQLPGQQLVLAPGTSHVELRFDAIEITSPEKIRMQYRMDGVDSEWLDVTPPGRAVYSTLPPGTHAFHVRASNRDGIWDRTGIVYLITQKPFFYQTTWFRVAMIATALLLVIGLYRLRLRQATARLNARFDERLAERTRIARELHDTLLQTIQGSKLVADDALERATDFTHLHGKVEQLSRWLGQATQEGRAALNSLRASSVETNDLAAALRRATEECSLEKSMAVKFTVTGAPRDTHPIPRDEIYRIGYEAIRNACEHSSATQLEVSLNYTQDLTLSVKDDGIGMEASVVTEGRPGHFGLQGMRERARQIGSKLTLVSAPDSGTEITLVVPDSVIYRKPSAARFAKLRFFFGKRDVTDESS